MNQHLGGKRVSRHQREAVHVIFDFGATRAVRHVAIVAPMIAGSVLLASCSSPTYGTDKTANAQLLSDVSNIVSVAPKRRAPIDYKPRPELVKPASTKDLALPPPQDSVAGSGNPDWPESPEQRRERLTAENTANRDKPGFQSSIIPDDGVNPEQQYGVNRAVNGHSDDGGHVSASQRMAQREEVKKRLAESRQGSATNRKYLSEPPLTYRQAAETAPQDDIGEDEYKKERAAKAAARKKGGWRDWIPGL